MKGQDPNCFAVMEIDSWSGLVNAFSEQKETWFYRGQRQDWNLASTLERSLENWNIDPQNGPCIERQLVREFRRRFRGDDQARVDIDSLYCLAVMQHYGAPTRLLDWTYSPYVATKFAIESGATQGVIWCFNADWCIATVPKLIPTINRRDADSSRNDTTFKPIYMDDDNRCKFVYNENAFHLSERLIFQQGVFLCPGDASASFVANLKELEGWELKENIIKLQLNLCDEAVRECARALIRMNVDSSVLFPGIDGFARSLGERLVLYRELAQRRTGHGVEDGDARRDAS
jgi:hypothetical protein